MSEKWAEEISWEDRILKSKYLIKRVENVIFEVIHLEESNNILLKTDFISSQIPRSYAANTFNLISNSLYNYYVLRVCMLWDKSSNNSFSIPTIACLLESDLVLEELQKYIFYANNKLIEPTNDDEINHLINENQRKNAEKTSKDCIENCENRSKGQKNLQTQKKLKR